jgi:hypothetical protein
MQQVIAKLSICGCRFHPWPCRQLDRRRRSLRSRSVFLLNRKVKEQEWLCGCIRSNGRVVFAFNLFDLLVSLANGGEDQASAIEGAKSLKANRWCN